MRSANHSMALVDRHSRAAGLKPWDPGWRDPAGYGLEPGAAGGGRRGHRPGDVVRRRARIDVGVRRARRRRREPRLRARGQAPARAAAARARERRRRSGWSPPCSSAGSCGRAPGSVSIGGFSVLVWHGALGAALAALVLVHALARAKRPRRRDLADRRQFLTAAAVGAGALAAWQLQRPLQRALGLPGAERRFTGSYDAGSFSGNDFPSTSWVSDQPRPRAIPLGGRRSRAARADAERRGARPRRRADGDARLHRRLLEHPALARACAWAGCSTKPGVRAGAGHVRVISRTGYRWSFGLDDARGLLLATHVGDEPLITRPRRALPARRPGPPRLPVGQVGGADRGPRGPRPGRARLDRAELVQRRGARRRLSAQRRVVDEQVADQLIVARARSVGLEVGDPVRGEHLVVDQRLAGVLARRLGEDR